jgi:hypothetical protein
MRNLTQPTPKSPSRNTPYAMSTVRSRLPRQLLWALVIGLLSFALAYLTSH